jgi:hypothetical protein
MSSWEDFKKKTDEKPPFRTIGGMFLCQTCREVVQEADYFFTDSVVRYKCSLGHFNLLEHFNLG